MEKNNNLMSGKGEKGKWITVNGSHVFIEDGQSVEDAMNKHFSKNGETFKSKKYTGDAERFNNLYDVYEKHSNLIQKGKYNDSMTVDIEDELRKLGLNQEGINRFWEDTGRENVKSTDDAIKIANSLLNNSLYRQGSNISQEELKERLNEATKNSERAKAKLLIPEERAKAEGINQNAERDRYYQAEQDIVYLKRALKGFNR